MELKYEARKETNPQDVAQLFNSCFAETAEGFIKQNGNGKSILSTKRNK
jgi:meiotically up-regulated gene 157 (Mug157) protein